MEENTGGNEDPLSSEVYLSMNAPNDWDTILEEADISNFTSICDYFPQTDSPPTKEIENNPLLTSLTPSLVTVPEYYLTRSGVDAPTTIDTDVLAQQIISRISCPANQDWEGKHKFNISFEKEGKLTNGVDWTYSSIVSKLFVNMDTSCPILFHTCKAPPTGCIIRAVPAFLKPKHTSEVVNRCPLHRDPKDQSNIKCVEIADHLVRCEATQAMYHCEPLTNRRSVTVPYVTPAEGMNYICYLYKFMCFCSCTGGGISKRPLQIIFTLEHNGEVIGRKVLNIRICASPGRDRKMDEEKDSNGKKTLAPKRLHIPDKGHCSKAEPAKRAKGSTEDIYTLQVKGKKNYKTLKYLNELMQFRDAAMNSKEDDDSN